MCSAGDQFYEEKVRCCGVRVSPYIHGEGGAVFLCGIFTCCFLESTF